MISEAKRRMKRRRILVAAIVIAISLAGAALFGVHLLAPNGPPSLQSEGTAQGQRGANGRVRARLSAEVAARLSAERAALRARLSAEAAAELSAERAARREAIQAMRARLRAAKH